MKEKNAFTMAEILTVIGIIGVVAAILIPPITNNVQEYSWKQAWKKNYSAIAQAYELVKLDEGGDLSQYFDATQNSSATPLFLEMGNYLSTVASCPSVGGNLKVCGYNKILDNSTYKTLSGGYIAGDNLFYVQYVLKDGANIYSRSWRRPEALIWVDVNGYGKKPNTLGKDLFGVVLTKDKIVPMGAKGTGVEGTCNSSSFTCPVQGGFHAAQSCSGAGCSAEYLYH